MEFKILINNEDVTDFVPFPLSSQFSLDESLDVGHLNLQYTNIAEPFKPFTSCDIFIDDAEYNFFISSDEVTEVIQNNVFNHSLLLIEQSKWLERFTGIVKTNTSTLIKNYADAKEYITIMTHLYGEDIFRPCRLLEAGATEYTVRTSYNFPTNLAEQYKSPDNILNQEIDVISPAQLYNSTWISNKTDSEIFYGFEIYYNGTKTFSTNVLNEIPAKYKFEAEGEYRFDYVTTQTDAVTGKRNVLTLFMYVTGQGGIVQHSITDVVEDLLATCESILETETPRFSFNEEQAVEYSSVIAPDFYLTGTLWECLMQVGSYIHALPRLKNNVIYFDKLGRNDLTQCDLSDYCSNVQRVDIEQFVSTIDSTLNNIVNVDEKEQGSVTAPFNKGLKTVRTEKGVVQITDQNLLIETREPIEEIISVECGYISGDRYVGDITPYVFESAEYDTLSMYSYDFPTSKGFALKYTQGQRNITGLNFKFENPVTQIFERFSIINIIARKLGVNPNTLATEDITKLQFRVKYIPVVSARFKQIKSDINEISFMSMLDFNQNATKVNSVAYGENMKGTIAKLGNPKVVKMYIGSDLNNIARVGDKFDKDYYISAVKVEYYKDFYKCEIALSKNYNKLNEYVGINSQKRFYEISEKESVDRYIVHEDYCVIGSDVESDNKSLFGTDFRRNIYGIDKFFYQFQKNNEQYFPYEIDVVKAVSVDEVGNKLKEVLLPVTSLAMGNSIVLSFHYDDNYSAGNIREDEGSTKLQYQVRYTDIYGRIDKLQLEFGNGGTSISDYNSAVAEGNSLPTTSHASLGINRFVTTEDAGKIVIKKDNRENIYFTYQLHFTATDSSYVIGTAMSRKSSFVTSEKRQCKLYGLPYELDKFTKYVDLTNATLLTDDIQGVYGANYIQLNLPQTAGNYKAWAIVTKDGELMLGQNTADKFNEFVKFTFTHKIA